MINNIKIYDMMIVRANDCFQQESNKQGKVMIQQFKKIKKACLPTTQKIEKEKR